MVLESGADALPHRREARTFPIGVWFGLAGGGVRKRGPGGNKSRRDRGPALAGLSGTLPGSERYS